jgi:hypothetical protein
MTTDEALPTTAQLMQIIGSSFASETSIYLVANSNVTWLMEMSWWLREFWRRLSIGWHWLFSIEMGSIRLKNIISGLEAIYV